MSSSLLDILSVDSFHNGLAKYFQHVLSIFEQARSFSHVADFASLGLQALESDHKSKGDLDYQNLRTDLLSRLFYASLKTCQFDTAYSALSRYTNFALQKSALSSLITAILNACGPGTAGLQQLLHFPLWLAPNLSSYVDEILLSLAKKQTSFSSSLDSDDQWWEMNHAPDYHRILHAYRIARDDLRGAAELGYQTVQRLRYARDAPSMQLTMARQGEEDTARLVEEDDLESKEIRHELLSLINLLACVDKREAYILVELDAPPSTISDAGTPGKRRGDDDDVFMDEATPSKPAGSTTSNGPSSPSASGSFVSFLDGNGRRRSSGATSVDHNNGKPPPLSRRQVIVTLEHLRREYQAELDRVSRLERGDWEFGAVETGADEDQNMDDTMLVNI
jgi:nuclear pore complex protein Nup160